MSPPLIPAGRVRVETRVLNSRFITTIAPADSASAAHEFVREMRSELPDATHHVYAFRIGHGTSVVEGMSDDGEPAGTSGPPTMAVLRGSGVGDVVLVTTRYFGGTKLGTGGLVAAYSQAAKNACAALQTVEKVLWVLAEVRLEYRLIAPVRSVLKEHRAVVREEEFGADVRIVFQSPEPMFDSLVLRIRDLSAGRAGVNQLVAE